MLFVSLKNNLPDAWPITHANLRLLIPEVSITTNPHQDAIGEHGYGVFEHTPEPTYSTDEHRLAELPPVKGTSGIWSQAWTLLERTPGEKREILAEIKAVFVIEAEAYAEEITTRGYKAKTWKEAVELRLRDHQTSAQDSYMLLVLGHLARVKEEIAALASLPEARNYMVKYSPIWVPEIPITGGGGVGGGGNDGSDGAVDF